MRTVLVVEDERDLRELLRRYLERAGLSVLTAASGAEAIHLTQEVRPDLVLLDLGLPDIDGTEVLPLAARTASVIVLTARSDVRDRIAGLQLGADDYVVKPFSPAEVVLRVQAVLARSAPREPGSSVLSFEGHRLVIDESCHEVRLAGHEVALTPSEWGLLVALASAPHRVLSRRELVERVGGYAYAGDERAIDTHVKNLRHKLGDTEHLIVQTVPTFGYRFGLQPDD